VTIEKILMPLVSHWGFIRNGAVLAVSALGFFTGLRGESPKRLVDSDIGTALDKARLSMLFQGKTAEECKQWQKKFKTKLNELLGDSTPPETWKATVEEVVQLDDHVRHHLLLEADGVPSVPVYLLIPKNLTKGEKTPGILCVHGHGEFGYDPIVGRSDLPGVKEAIQKSHYDYGLQFVRKGYVVAAPCMVPFGRRVNRKKYGGQDPCAVTLVRMQALGQLPITANLRDLRWCLDLLQSRPEVKADKLGCAGLSYGGRMTMMVTAMDQRIKVASVSGALNLLQERLSRRYSCGAQVIPNLLQYGDYSEIGSLIAPRPCVWETGSMDGLIVPKWDDVFRKRLQNAYQALRMEKNLVFDRFEGAHRWNGKVAYPLFGKVLK
jgi:dienelactone hydrolase